MTTNEARPAETGAEAINKVIERCANVVGPKQGGTYSWLANRIRALATPTPDKPVDLGAPSDGEIYSRSSFDSADHKRGFLEGLRACVRPPVDLGADAERGALEASGGALLPRDFLSFLLGEAAYDGVWFGERRDADRGVFWWRSLIREALRIANLPPPETPVSADSERGAANRIPTRPVCARCSQYIAIDTEADNDLWEAVIGPRDGPGYICAGCFVRAADEKMIDWTDKLRFRPISFARQVTLQRTPPIPATDGEREALNIMHTAFAGYADTPAKREAVALAADALRNLSTPSTSQDGEAGNA